MLRRSLVIGASPTPTPCPPFAALLGALPLLLLAAAGSCAGQPHDAPMVATQAQSTVYFEKPNSRASQLRVFGSGTGGGLSETFRMMIGAGGGPAGLP